MDFKNLIERLNQYSADYQCHGGITAEAADAIKTLLAEREAAINTLRALNCHACKYEEQYGFFPPCNECVHGGGDEDNWQWRGPTPPDRQ